jgi:hypothetical protein
MVEAVKVLGLQINLRNEKAKGMLKLMEASPCLLSRSS